VPQSVHTNSVYLLMLRLRVYELSSLSPLMSFGKDHHFFPGRWAKCNDQRVCMSVCLSVRLHNSNKKLRYRRRTARRAMLASKCYMFHEVWEFERFQTAKVTFMVIQVYRKWCHSIGHKPFLISLPCRYVYILHRFLDIITYFLKLKEVT